MKKLIALVFLLLFVADVCFAGQLQEKLSAVVKARGAAAGPANAPTFVNGAGQITGTGTCSYTQSITAGNTILFFISSDTSGVSFSAVGDGVNSYTQLGTKYTDDSAHPFITEVYTATAATTATLTFTAHVSGTTNEFLCLSVQYSNCDGVDKGPANAANNATKSFVTGTTDTTTVTKEAVVGYFALYVADTIIKGTGYEIEYQQTLGNYRNFVEDKTVTATGAYQVTATTADNGGNGTGIAVTLKGK